MLPVFWVTELGSGGCWSDWEEMHQLYSKAARLHNLEHIILHGSISQKTVIWATPTVKAWKLLTDPHTVSLPPLPQSTATTNYQIYFKIYVHLAKLAMLYKWAVTQLYPNSVILHSSKNLSKITYRSGKTYKPVKYVLIFRLQTSDSYITF